MELKKGIDFSANRTPIFAPSNMRVFGSKKSTLTLIKTNILSPSKLSVLSTSCVKSYHTLLSLIIIKIVETCWPKLGYVKIGEIAVLIYKKAHFHETPPLRCCKGRRNTFAKEQISLCAFAACIHILNLWKAVFKTLPVMYNICMCDKGTQN